MEKYWKNIDHSLRTRHIKRISYSKRNLPISEFIESESDFSYQDIDKLISEDKIFNDIKSFISDTKIIYLPTYRRIEQELKHILEQTNQYFRRSNRDYHRRLIVDYKEEIENCHIELVEFGMNDVKESTNKALSDLKEFARENLNSLTLGYLGDIIDKKYKTSKLDLINEVTDDEIKSILDRVDKKILSAPSRENVHKAIKNIKKGRKIEDHEQLICHYFIKLINFQKELQKKEQNIRDFCNVCNGYMVDKLLTYTSASFGFEILSKNKGITEDIKLNHLSSGEKQIVSLFNHMYLSNKEDCFIIIDEPELSLSVTWQRKFLVDVTNGVFCSGLIAATHSPFIYDNELEKYTHGLGEFIT